MLKYVIISNYMTDEFLTFKEPTDIVFYNQNKEIGRLKLDKDICHFEGNATESAKVFFDNVILQYMNFKNN